MKEYKLTEQEFGEDKMDYELAAPCGLYCGTCRQYLLLKKDLLEERGYHVILDHLGFTKNENPERHAVVYASRQGA